jgi:hypothetical protein
MSGSADCAKAPLNLCLTKDMVKWGVHSYAQHALTDWESPYMDFFGPPPSLPEEEVATPGDLDHWAAMAAAHSSGSLPTLLYKYFAKYRPECLQGLSLNDDPPIYDIETNRAISMLSGIPKSKIPPLDELLSDSQSQSLQPRVTPQATYGEVAPELRAEPRAKPAQASGITLSQAKKNTSISARPSRAIAVTKKTPGSSSTS